MESVDHGTRADSVLVRDGQAPEVLTAIYGWPSRAVTVDGHTLERPLIMEVP